MNQLFLSHSIKLTAVEIKKLSQLYELFSHWNQKINLSAIRDKEGVYEKHFVDSLLATKYIDFNGKKVLDLGAGGGFPVFPLSIISEGSTFSALDSVGKKMKAVQDMAGQLDLPVKTFHGRIEEYGQDKKFREQFDIVTARALASWPVLLEYALPFVKVGGVFVAYQGPAIVEDLEVFKGVEKKLGGEIKDIFEDQLGAENKRFFVIVEKMRSCSKKYPRNVGEPKKNPIKS